MNVINVKINFEKGTNTIMGTSLVSGDYASTKLVFDFDTDEGTKIFEMKNPQGETVIVQEITDNELLLAGVDENENYYSLFNGEGMYVFEVSLYDNGTKITSTSNRIPVKQEQVLIGDEVVEPYLPVFEELLQDVSEALTQMDNWDIEATKENNVETITITDSEGNEHVTYIYDGETGNGISSISKTGTSGLTDTYTITYTNGNTTTFTVTNGKDGVDGVDGVDGQDGFSPTVTSSKSGGTTTITITDVNGTTTATILDGETQDLTDYVKNTDYATSSKGGVIKAHSIFGTEIRSYGNYIGNITALTKTYSQYQDSGNDLLVGKGTLENVITGKDLATKSYVDSKITDALGGNY